MANLSNINNKFIVSDAGHVSIGNVTTNTYLVHAKSSGINNAILALESSSWSAGASAELRLSYVAGHERSIKGGYATGLEFYTNNATPAIAILPGGSASGATGNVGIGTNSPWEKLSIPFNESLSFGNLTYPLSISRSSAGNLKTTISDSYDSAATQIDFKMRLGSANEINALSILGSGNIGIGTDSPVRNVSVFGSSSAVMSFHNSTTGSTISDGMFVGNDANLAYVFNYEATPLVFATSATERMRINSGGNVNLLNATSTDSKHFGITNAAGTTGWTFGNGVIANSHQFVIYDNTAGSSRILIDNDGNVGIGTDSPVFKLDIRTSTPGDRAVLGVNSATSGTNYGGQFNSQGSGATKNIGLYATAEGATTNYAGIFDSGNVGIGTTSPETQLSIGDYTDSAETITIATLSNGTGRINFYDNNNTEGGSIRVVGELGGSKMYFSNRWNTDNDRVVFDLINGKVGIDTTSPQSKLDLLQPDSSANTLGQSVTAALGIRMANAVGQVGQIVFNNDAAPSYGYGSIGMIMTSGTGVGLGDMIFATKGTGSDSASTERMRIDSNGAVGIGANNVSYRLRIKSDATVDNGIYLSAGTNFTNHSLYVENRDATAEFFAVRGDGEIRFNASSGHTYAAQGIRFGANATANNLNYYEEGNWTPVIAHNDGTGVVPITVNAARYLRVGQLVYVSAYLTGINPNGNAGGSGPYYGIRGFPFQPENYGAWQIVYASSGITAYGGYSGGASLYFMANGTNGQRSQAHLNGAGVNAWGSSLTLMMNCVYNIHG